MISLQSSLGIQFGKDYLLLVHLKKFIKEVILDCHELIPFPSDLMEEELVNFCPQEISRFIKEKAIGRENVWAGLPRNEFLLRFITLPFSAEENLREVIRYEMDKYIPFPEEKVIFDFLIMERDAEAKNLKLLLLVIQKTVLEKYLSILQKAGVTPLGIEMSSTSLLNFFLMGKNGSEGKAVALLNVQKHGFELNWVSRGILRYSRANDFYSEANGEQVKQIKEELRNSFRTTFPLQAWGEREEDSFSVVFLTGDGTKDGLINELVNTTEIDIQNLTVEDISTRRKFSSPFSPSLAVGVGLALRGMNSVQLEINLLPRLLRKKIRKMGLYLSFFLFIAALVLSLTWGVSTIVKERLELRKLKKEINALKDGVLATQKIQKEAQALIQQLESLQNIRKSEFSKLEILKELSNIFPATVWLTDFQYNKNALQLAGFADSASGLIAILDKSPLFYASEFTAPITRDLEGKENFKITTRIEGR